MNRLRDLRKAKKVSQSTVAQVIGVSARTYAYYESEAREANYYTLKKLSKYFNVSIDYILGASDLPYRDSELALELDEERILIEKYREIKKLDGAQTVISFMDTLEKSLKK